MPLGKEQKEMAFKGPQYTPQYAALSHNFSVGRKNCDHLSIRQVGL